MLQGLTEADLRNPQGLVALLNNFGSEIERLKQNVADLKSSPGNANLVQEVDGLKDRVDGLQAQPHPGGLCGEAGCTDCAGTRSRYVKLQSDAILANRKEIFAKLNQAAQLEDLVEQANLLAQRFVAIEKGTPGPQVINLPGGERLVIA